MRIKKPTKKKFIKTMIIILLLVGLAFSPKIIIHYLNTGNPYTKYLINKRIPPHLEKQGYTESDILEQHYIEPKAAINRKLHHGHYMVIFEDEPDLEYYYGITKFKNKVVQFCNKREKTAGLMSDVSEHSEQECVDQLPK